MKPRLALSSAEDKSIWFLNMNFIDGVIWDIVKRLDIFGLSLKSFSRTSNLKRVLSFYCSGFPLFLLISLNISVSSGRCVPGGWSLEIDVSSHVGSWHCSVTKSRRKMFRIPEGHHMHLRVTLFICHLFKMKRDFCLECRQYVE